MLSIVMVVFFGLLLLGMPIAHVIVAASTIGVMGDGNSALVIVQQLVNGLNTYVNLAVPFFIISGDIAAKGLTSERLIDVINAWTGRLRGGLGIAAVVACTIFGAITGSAMATVVAIGALMLPKLLENGYPRGLSIGIIACAGTLGVMIPPSIPMLNMAVALGTSVSAQFLAGVLPGVLTAAAICLYVVYVAKRKNVPLLPRISFKEKLRVTKRSFWALMFPVLVLGSIYSGLATPTEASVLSLVYVIFVELAIYRKISMKEMINIFTKASISSATMMLTIAAAKAFVWYMTTAQVPTMLYNTIVGSISSKYTLIFALILLFFIAGCFTNIQTVVIILGPILLPVLQYYGINAMHFIIICVMMAQIGFITPPFGLCLFVTIKVAKSNMVEVTKASIPIIIIMFVVTMTLVFFPKISLLLPSLVFPSSV